MKNLKKYALALDVMTEVFAGQLREAIGEKNVLCVGGDCIVCYVKADSFGEAKVRLFDAFCAVSSSHFPMALSEIRMFGCTSPAAVASKVDAKQAALAKITKKILDLETLETRKSDGLDFHDMAVWTLKAALEAAFEAGQAAAVRS